MTPQKITKPLVGVDLYNLSLSFVEVIAASTDYLVVLDLIPAAELNS
jgi:hypothetical protein